jgi:hypothetical protein
MIEITQPRLDQPQMSDSELIAFIEANGIQLWPVRKSKHGPILHWYAQATSPFQQLAAPTARLALARLFTALSRNQNHD